MIRIVLPFSLWAAIAVAPGAAMQSRLAPSDQEVLEQLERDWDAAFLQKDLKFIEQVLADEFIATYDDGTRGDKAKELMLTSEFNQNHARPSRIATFPTCQPAGSDAMHGTAVADGTACAMRIIVLPVPHGGCLSTMVSLAGVNSWKVAVAPMKTARSNPSA